MSSRLIISVSGLRGVVGDSLVPEVAGRYAGALAQELESGPIVVTRDGRDSGRMLADVVRGNLMAMGRDVIDADIAATPTTGILVRNSQAAGGIQISASHNPSEYNGMKLFGQDGRVVSAGCGERVLAAYENPRWEWAHHSDIGQLRTTADAHQKHLEMVLAIVNVDKIRDRRFRVLLDSNHGAGGLLGRRLLDHLGCEVVQVGAEPNGLFSHPPEPTAANLQKVCQRVRETKVDVGFCQDPDADRLALIDEQGTYIGEEYTLAACLAHVLRNCPGPVVTNCSTSRMAQDLAQRFGVPFYRSKVGEANVADEMICRGAVFGGEGNGGPIDPRVGYVRDSFVGVGLVLNALADRGQQLSDLVSELPRYEIFKTKVVLEPDQVERQLDMLEQHFRTATSDRLDGLRLDWHNRWLLVRASNTEPIVRLVAEAGTLAEAQTLCSEAASVLSA